MKFTLLTLALMCFGFIPAARAMDEKPMDDMAVKAEMAAPQNVKAVFFFSENCGACKILDPKMKQAMAAVNMAAIDVITLDFTSKETIETLKTVAADKGVDHVLQKFGAKTGFVTLVDSKGEIIGSVSPEDTTEDIAAKLTKAIIQAS